MSADLVEQLVNSQHPDLINAGIREMAPGFDNTIWRLGDDLVVRFPRRQVAVPLIKNEQRWLPELARRLPLAIPTPIRFGQPSDHSRGPGPLRIGLKERRGMRSIRRSWLARPFP